MAKPMQQLAWQIGDIKITSFPETENPNGPQYIYNDLDKKRVVPYLQKHPWLAPLFIRKDGNLILRVQIIVIDTGAHRIVVDTGIGNGKKRHVPIWNNMNTDVFDRMAAAGYHPNTITEVFCTHLHDDHCGGCTKFVDGRWVPTFKNAEYVYNITEFDYWRVTEYKGGDEVFQDSVKPIIDAGLAKFVDPLKYQLCPGVRFESTPGHTPGHVSVIVESGGKRAIVTGDMIHNPLQIAEPRVTSHFDWNSAIAVETRLAFLKKWTDGETIIIGTHFGNPTAGLLRHKGGESWELDPGPEGARIAAINSTKL